MSDESKINVRVLPLCIAEIFDHFQFLGQEVKWIDAVNRYFGILR